jgi:Putative addiction module component
MDTTSIRQEIHQYIDGADERFLNLIYGMIKADKEELYLEDVSSEEIQLIEERLAEYYRNPNNGSDWEEVEKRIKG